MTRIPAFLSFLLLTTYLKPAEGCMGGKLPPPPPTNPPIDIPEEPTLPPVTEAPPTPGENIPTPAPPPQGPLPSDFGEGAVTPRPDDSNKVPPKDVKHPSELSCNFETRRSCCWQVVTGPPGKPQFLKAVKTGVPYDEASIQRAFGTTVAPDGNFLFAQYENGVQVADVAEYRSCTVSCIKGTSVSLTVKHWIESPSRLRVCLRDPFDSRAPYIDCDEAPLFSDPGPTTLNMIAPEGSPFEIIIVADNFGPIEGRLVAIDDITADFVPCDEETTTKKPKAGSPLCPIECDFETSFCNMRVKPPGTGVPPVTNMFQRTDDEIYGNEDTGCPRPPNGGSYMGTKLQSLDVSSVYIPGIKQQPGKDLSLMLYEATMNIYMTVCKVDTKTNTESCQEVSPRDVSLTDREWKNARIPMDGKFDQLEINAISQGENIGSVCFDSLRIVNSKDPPFGFEGPPPGSKTVCK